MSVIYSYSSKKTLIQLNKESTSFMEMQNMPDKVEENGSNFVMVRGCAVEVTTAIELHNKLFQKLHG